MTPPDGRGSRIRRAIVAVHLVTAVALVAAAAVAVRRLGGAEVLSAGLAVALALTAAQLVGQLAAWGVLLRAVAHGGAAPRHVVARSWLLGWMARYVPGPPVGMAGKFLVCWGAGISPAAVGAALGAEVMLHVTSGVMLILLMLPLAVDLDWGGPMSMAGGVGFFVASVVAAPRLAPRAGVWLRQREAGHRMPERRALLKAGLWYAAGTVIAALAFHATAATLTSVAWTDPRMTVFAYTLAGWVGFIIPLLPSGAGAREAVLVAILGPQIGHTEALSVAIIARAMAVAVDSSLGLGVAAFLGYRSAARWKRPFRSAETSAKARA